MRPLLLDLTRAEQDDAPTRPAPTPAPAPAPEPAPRRWETDWLEETKARPPLPRPERDRERAND